MRRPWRLASPFRLPLVFDGVAHRPVVTVVGDGSPSTAYSAWSAAHYGLGIRSS